jgi:hypothetical protein
MSELLPSKDLCSELRKRHGRGTAELGDLLCHRAADEIERLRTIIRETALLADDDGPGEEDGPWSDGWARRSVTDHLREARKVLLHFGTYLKPDHPDALVRWAARVFAENRVTGHEPKPVQCLPGCHVVHALQCTARAGQPPAHDESQCWEPCGALGKSEAHAVIAEPAQPPAATEPMGWARVFPDGRHEVSHGKWRESDHHDSERWTVIPLYARAGQPPEVAQMRAILDDIAVAAWAEPEPSVTLDSFLAWLRSELQPYVNAPTKEPSRCNCDEHDMHCPHMGAAT